MSFVMAARGEGPRIGARVHELNEQLKAANVRGEIILVLDGVDSPGISDNLQDGPASLTIVRLPNRVGKAAAISRGVEQATGEIVAFADVRQRWASDALKRMLDRFEDAEVGAVSGELVLEESGGNRGVGFYWKYEKWIRRHESDFDSLLGVTGAIAAVRRALFRPIPPGTLLDDMFWPMSVVMSGHRVVHEAAAIAFDRLPNAAADEFRRKVRTLTGNYQLVARLPSALLFWRNRVWWQLISHKLLRLAVPWALLVAFALPCCLPGPFFLAVACLEPIALAALLLGALYAESRRPRWASVGLSFTMLNFAAWLAFWVWISGNATKSWGAVNYTGPS